MKGQLLSGFLACVMVAAINYPAAAHHAFIAQYDSTKPGQISGVVVKVEWLNPHAYFYVDVADDSDGSVRTWAVEMGSPVVLMRRGWTRNSLKIGDVVTIDGVLARDDSPSINAQSVVLASTGQRLFTRSADEERQVARPSPETGK